MTPSAKRPPTRGESPKRPSTKPPPPNRPLRIGVTVGDPAGVGPEVALKSLLGHGEGSGESVLAGAEVVLIGPDWVFADVVNRYGLHVRFRRLRSSARTVPGSAAEKGEARESEKGIGESIGDPKTPAFRTFFPTEAATPLIGRPGGLGGGPSTPAPANGGDRPPSLDFTVPSGSPESIPVFKIRVPRGCEVRFEIPYGQEDPLCGTMALLAIQEAVRMAMSGKIDAIVTAPISKAAIRAAGSKFPGHTEMLQSLTQSPRVGMMLVGGGLRVSLATIHEAYAAVPGLLTVERVAAMIRLTHDFLCQWGIPEPRLALCGLNPHAGEGGLFGDEESRILLPAINAARVESIAVDGPFPADTVFHLAREGHFDAVVALYHDQALIPIKTLDFHGGVNVTMGLPIIRTSPDHGTAYGIAGRGLARATSMRNAVRIALELATKRRETR